MCSENTKERGMGKMIPVFLTYIEIVVLWIETNISSVVLLGEYPFPKKEEE